MLFPPRVVVTELPETQIRVLSKLYDAEITSLGRLPGRLKVVYRTLAMANEMRDRLSS